jgi:hypothetical protein
MRQIDYFSLKTRGRQIEGERQPLDEYLSHVPDVEARRIARTAPRIEKTGASNKEYPAL